MGLIPLLLNDPKLFAALVVLLLYSVIFHEVAHGAVAYCFGDDTAARRGRLTLNPLPHIDPVGAILLFVAGFGWARPVPVSYQRLRNRRVGLVCVALAGVVTNILIAMLAIFFLRLEFTKTQPLLLKLLPIVLKINLILAAFNLLPIPPLDGSKVLLGFLPEKAGILFEKLEPVGFLVLMILLVTGLLNPALEFAQRMILTLIAPLFR